MVKQSKLILVCLLVTAFLSACKTSQDEQINITGDVWYRERMALPANAMLTIQLQDVSKADAPAEVIAKQQIKGVRTPMPFSFVISREQLKATHTYTVSGKITLNDQLLFINTQAYRIDLNTNKPISVLMNRVMR